MAMVMVKVWVTRKGLHAWASVVKGEDIRSNGEGVSASTILLWRRRRGI
jgi:hypothetical protein